MENIYAKVRDSVKDGIGVAIDTVIDGNEGNIADGLKRTLTEPVATKDAKGNSRVAPEEDEKDGKIHVVEPVLPKERLIVLGGGHIAKPVCEFSAKCGFEVYVCDDRPAFANEERFPLAQEVLCDTFENCINKLHITPYDYVVIITRGHVHDADCLRAILPGKQPAYLGLIGSRRRVKGLLEMLVKEGYSKENIERICTPIGLSIGAVTPEEIAISILSELISYKRLPEKNIDDTRHVNFSDLDLYMMDYLADNHEPKAVVTVIQTKGSTPRNAGAKMAVSPAGQVTGSIGGGCSEGAVIRDAIDIIGTGKYKTMFIDMTGEVAESDGMVCGGIMKVLVEDGSEATN
ncbi:MAG: XdhC family protein [Anaerovoracaceae bacterium]|jgi:xanthine dehydrogenase accessory factor